jgi:hypothetical protein
MAHYTCYFAAPSPGCAYRYQVTCDRLAGRLRDLGLDLAEKPPEDPAGEVLGNVLHWTHAALLRWGLRCERTINAAALAARLADLQAGGELEQVRLSVRRLVAAMRLIYPALAAEDGATLAQLVALGQEMAETCAVSEDIYAYVKNELQPVDLAGALQLGHR